MIDQIIAIITEILAMALATALICLIRSGIARFISKCTSEKTQLALQEFQTVLEDGVGFIEQTFVRLAKEGGTWNTTTQREALEDCIKYIQSNLTQKTLDILTEDKEDIEDWIEAKIEAYIQYDKRR